MNTKKTTYWLLLGSIILIHFASSQCSPPAGRSSAEANSITLHYWPDESAIGPVTGMPAFALVFCPPFTWDENGDTVGWLVDSWEHSPDFRTWSYKLHDNIRWHDGVPMTSADVEFTFELLSHPDVMGLRPESFDFKIIDEYTYSITHKDKSLNPLEDYMFYFPKHLLEDLDPKDFESWEFWAQPVGNGPYRYVRHIPKTMVELEANPDYFRGRPKINKVILKFAGDKLTELLAGNVDAFWENMVFDLNNNQDYRMYFKSTGRPALTWNHRLPLFQERDVRKALALAVNRRELFQLDSLPDDIPVADFQLSRRQLLTGDIPDPIPYDPELAMKLLDEAGWKDTNNDGIREKDGVDFHFTVITSPNPLAQKGSVYLQAQFRRIGIKMEIQSLAAAIVRSRYMSGDYEAALYRGGNLDYYVESENGPSATGYLNPELQALWKTFQEDFDPLAQDRLYKKVQRIFKEDVPALFLAPGVYVTVAHKKIKGLKSPNRVWPEYHMEHLWIEEKN